MLLNGSIGNLGHKNQNEEPYLGSRGSAVQGGEKAIRLESDAVYSRGSERSSRRKTHGIRDNGK